MKIQALLFSIACVLLSCTNENKDVVESILENMETRLNANNSTIEEVDEMFKGQGMKRTLKIGFYDVKNIDLMDVAIKIEIKAFVQELKNNIEGSERIEKYRVKLIKDPNDRTPAKSGFNILEKGYTFNREDI